MADADNLVFGKYRVIRRIAVGGMGEIFLGRQTGVAGFDRLVILKTMLPDLAEEEGFLEQLLDEARVAATLNHPNIVNIYKVGQWQGVYIIAMEYIKGDHLGRLIQHSIKSKKPMPCEVAAQIVHDGALALDHAHVAIDTEGKPLRIVHRDIGLQNIMVRFDGVTKVVNFGVARAANRSTRTRTGLVKGKLPYMSPEQAAGASVLVDGVARGTTPLSLDDIEPGRSLRIQVERQGYEPVSTELALQASESRELTIPLFRSRGRPTGKRPVRVVTPTTTPTPAPGTDRGFLSVRTTPWTKVFVDSNPYGSTPLYKDEIPPRRHTVRLVNEGEGIDATRTITIEPGKTAKLDATLKK